MRKFSYKENVAQPALSATRAHSAFAANRRAVCSSQQQPPANKVARTSQPICLRSCDVHPRKKWHDKPVPSVKSSMTRLHNLNLVAMILLLLFVCLTSAQISESEIRLEEVSNYRVTHHIDPLVLLTWKQKLRFCIRSIYCRGHDPGARGPGAAELYLQLLFSCQQNKGSNMMCHPVHPKCNNFLEKCWHITFREEIKFLQILLSRTQAGPGRTVKQEEYSPNHVQRINLITVQY